MCRLYEVTQTHFCLYFKELEKTLDVFNITISRQQAEVEVILDYLSIGKNKSRFHVDLTDNSDIINVVL